MSLAKQLHQPIIALCKEYNKKAQMQLYNLYCKAMFLVSLWYVKDRFIAEDVMQAGATFDLNTRHCKVKMQNTVVSGSVSYGSFDAHTLFGGDLKINYSFVTINALNDFNLHLNNVSNATISSVENLLANIEVTQKKRNFLHFKKRVSFFEKAR